MLHDEGHLTTIGRDAWRRHDRGTNSSEPASQTAQRSRAKPVSESASSIAISSKVSRWMHSITSPSLVRKYKIKVSGDVTHFGQWLIANQSHDL